MSSEGRACKADGFIVYDGECPFCSRYVALLRLKEAYRGIQLVDARSDHPAVQRAVAAGIDLNDGMALIQDDRIYHGDECIHRLALMSTPSTLFNKLNAAIFRSPLASKLLYPILRAGRNTTLGILGKEKITR